jgi:hypothetical protein
MKNMSEMAQELTPGPSSASWWKRGDSLKIFGEWDQAGWYQMVSNR